MGARFPIQPSTRGHLEVSRRRIVEGPLDAGAAKDLNSVLEQLRVALNGGLSLGDGQDGARAGNLDAQVRTFTTPPVKLTQFAVPHGLGRVAVGYIPILKSAHCDLATASGHGWTDDVIWLQASAGGVDVTLLVF